MGKPDDWKAYWSNQSDPRHSENSERFFEYVANEISFHLGDLEGKRILEIGCGDGALLSYLGIGPEQYTGIDFSSSLLEKFRIRHNGYAATEADALGYLTETDQQFDVIFSFGVLQYFSETDLQKLFLLQSRRLSKGGLVIHFGIPIKEHKSIFTTGLTARGVATKKRGMLKRTKSALFNKIGYWHRLDRLCQISQEGGFTTEVVGGVNYLYRINLIQGYRKP